MDIISNYSIIETIKETKNSIIYKARKDNDDDVVTIKRFKDISPSPADIVRIKKECERIKQINISGAVKLLDFIEYKSIIAIVFEDFESVSLKDVFNDAIDIDFFLETAIQLANNIGKLHEKKIIHKEIKPSNIRINTKTNIVKISDFGISSFITHENDSIYNPEIIENTLFYMSPEQTGRMNRSTDYRTDLYSLGIVLYEMITGKPPFLSIDPLKIIYNHLAVMPKPPNSVKSDTPEVISQIVMKLIAKMPEERYQNAFGLEEDLRECILRIQDNKMIPWFPIAQKDRILQFIIPEKIYGRDNEINQLLTAFKNVADYGSGETQQNRLSACEVVLVTGNPGIGKTVMINEIYKPVFAHKGFFLQGKFEQFCKDLPYSAIILVFRQLISQILSETEKTVTIWRNNIQAAITPNGKVITDIIPDLELIIGKQPDLAEFESDKEQNRLRFVFENFIRVFTKKEHPIVIFIDDLQWADTASLELITSLLTNPATEYLLFIGSYRNQEVDKIHPLTDTISNIKRWGVPVNSISLQPLAINHVTGFISELLMCSDSECKELSNLVHKKTLGNPFFVKQFLLTLKREGVFSLDAINRWTWDINAIRKMQVTSNVVDLITERISKLSPEATEIIKICACTGMRFDIESLAIISHMDIESVHEKINEAVNEELITPVNDFYIFQHDKILEAAYSLVSEEKKAEIHYRIGKFSKENTNSDEMETKLFYIVNQLNRGAICIKDSDEKQALAVLNFRAGSKAKASVAYEQGLIFFSKGIELISWEKDYDLSLKLHDNAAICARNTDIARMAELIETVLKNSKNNLDSINVYILQILTAIQKNDLTASIDIAVNALSIFGIHIKTNVKLTDILMGLFKTKLMLIGKTPEKLLTHKTMTDPYKISAMKLLKALLAPTYIANPKMHPAVILKMVQLSVKYGHTKESVIAYNAYGIFLCGVLYDFDGGNRFGKMGLSLIKKFEAYELLPMANFLYYCFIYHWSYGLKPSIGPLLKCSQQGYDAGDTEYAGYSLLTNIFAQLLTGYQLNDIEKDCRKFCIVVARSEQSTPLATLQIGLQIVLNLMGESDDVFTLTGEAMNEENMGDLLIKNSSITALSCLYNCKLILSYILGQYSVQTADKAMQYLDGSLSAASYPFILSFDTLLHLALYESSDKPTKRQILKRVKKNRKILFKCNYSQKMILIDAELAGINNNKEEAIDLYNKAISIARDLEEPMIIALSCERAADFYRKNNMQSIADHFLKDAFNTYQQWGAKAKTRQLINTFPDILTGMSDCTGKETGSDLHSLDISSFQKASQTISGEIFLNNLLEKIMIILMENTGAQKGGLLLENKGRFFIEAMTTVDSDQVTVLQSIPVEESPDLSNSIVQYVARTKKTVLIHDAQNEKEFINDDYLLSNNSKSILCQPIIKQGRLSCIIYLENNISTNVFTEERLKLINILSSQVAVSIDNARLYENLEEKVKERTNALDKSLEKINSSINYASIIQRSLLPDHNNVVRYLPDSFFIWQPRDIVGGDIYFCEKLNSGIIIAIIDCTGHGVPGAFMAMLASSSLRRIVNEERVTEPCEILKRLNHDIKTSLQQDKDHASSDDGLDAGVCYFDPKTRILKFSSARIPLYIINNGDLIQIKGDKKSIGYISSDLSYNFTTHEIENKAFDLKFYMTTDGFTDQLGGSKRKRFGTRQFKSLITEHHNLPFEKQSYYLLEALKKHQNSTERIDDVTVVGFKFV